MRPMPQLVVHELDIDELVPYENNAKLHPLEQIEQIESSIEEFGFNDPIAVWHDEDGNAVVVEGHGRLKAAKRLGLEKLPVIYLDTLSDEQRRAYSLVHNQLTMNSGFDIETLQNELDSIFDIDMSQYDLEIETFEPSFDDVENEQESNESVTVKVLFHDPDLYQTYRDTFSKMEKDGASVSIS